MSLIGLDFGSRTLSIAIYYEDKDMIEVIADELGSRTIPCCVAFRNGEVLKGLGAISQQHKNASNTFDDIRNMLILASPESETIYVPSLEKDIPIIELASHFFRNVTDQVKQQVGKAVKDCVIALPESLDAATKERIVKAAQAGGLRVKAIIPEPISVLLAYHMDDSSLYSNCKVAVVDMGWNKTEVALYQILNGVFSKVTQKSSSHCCGRDMVRLVAEHCAKDFQRKTQCSLVQNQKAMLRLRTECEVAIKSLSTAAEVTIALDSLFEGMDYSFRLSRARLQDLCAVSDMHLKNLVNEVLGSVPSLKPADVAYVCPAGGLVSVPKSVSTLRALFPAATFIKSRLDPAEAQCTGAAIHGKHLIVHKLLETSAAHSLPPAVSSRPELPALANALYLAGQPGGPHILLAPAGALLPFKRTVPASLPPRVAGEDSFSNRSLYLQIATATGDASQRSPGSDPVPVEQTESSSDSSIYYKPLLETALSIPDQHLSESGSEVQGIDGSASSVDVEVAVSSAGELKISVFKAGSQEKLGGSGAGI